MALITCPECSKQISDRAPACPHCGIPMQTASVTSSAPATALTAGEIRVRCPGRWSFRAGRERQEIQTPSTVKFFSGEVHRFSAKPVTAAEAASISELATVAPLKYLWIMLSMKGASLGHECVMAMKNFIHVEDVTLNSPEMTFNNDCLGSIVTMSSLREIRFLGGCDRINDQGIVQIAAAGCFTSRQVLLGPRADRRRKPCHRSVTELSPKS